MTEDPRIEAFFADAAAWRAELTALRALLRDCPVDETFKWRAPCYTAAGGNIATLWGLKDFCGLSFFKGVLLADPEGVLVAPGRNSRSVRMARFTDLAGIAAKAAALKAWMREAVALEASGAKVNLSKDDPDRPDELRRALDDDPALDAAFAALTPGRRRGWILNIAQPKGAEARARRVARAAPRILAGKGMHDR